MSHHAQIASASRKIKTPEIWKSSRNYYFLSNYDIAWPIYLVPSSGIKTQIFYWGKLGTLKCFLTTSLTLEYWLHLKWLISKKEKNKALIYSEKILQTTPWPGDRFNIISEKLLTRTFVKLWKEHFTTIIFFLKTYNPSQTLRKTLDKIKLGDIVLNNSLAPPKNYQGHEN